jgi:hypothetical protein
MAKLTWKIKNGATDLTSLVRSLDFTVGRQNAVSAYGPSFLSFTMTNTNNGASLPAVQDEIVISVKNTGIYVIVFTGRVTQRNFNDGPGAGLNSTCTIVIANSIEPLGTLNNTNFAAVASQTVLNTLSSSSYYGDLTGTTDFNMSAATGQNGLSLANNVIAGDGGVVRDILYFPPSDFPNQVTTQVTFGPSTSATQIGYQSFLRTEGSSNGTFFTAAQVTFSDGTTTTANAANVYYYGQRFITVNTAITFVDDTAEWYANAFSDPTVETLEFSWTDTAQNSSALDECVNWFFNFGSQMFVSCSYTPPGGVLKTAYYWTEQTTVSATINGTTVSMIMTPATQYGRFILDDAVFGVLGGSPVYDSAIDYNEIAYTYNDSNAEQGNRLGV